MGVTKELVYGLLASAHALLENFPLLPLRCGGFWKARDLSEPIAFFRSLIAELTRISQEHNIFANQGSGLYHLFCKLTGYSLETSLCRRRKHCFNFVISQSLKSSEYLVGL